MDESSWTTKISLLPEREAAFSNWQSKFRSQISKADGFISLEILSPLSCQNNTWILNQRFDTQENLNLWLNSTPYKLLLKELTDDHIVGYPHAISEKQSNRSQNGVTEVYVTFVDKEKLPLFHQWHEKIHQVESTFPGFQKVYVQAPNAEKKEGAWITLLQFNSSANLENWLTSPERSEILKESQSFITARETHRLLSSFGGWFTDRSLSINPPRWKQTMLVLAVLFPIVMLQYIYLTPYLVSFNPSLRTFIDNMISVSLISWPMLPIAIYALKWWLEEQFDPLKNLIGIGVLLLIYILEIFLFSNFV